MYEPRSVRRSVGLAAIVVVAMLSSPVGFAFAHTTDDRLSDCADAGDNMHPSGKDRSCETGSLGRSGSDPDGSSNGGADKPGGTGGVDLGDQDGNNGCGNDDDFEDDNNGNCGGRRPAADVGPESAAAAAGSRSHGRFSPARTGPDALGGTATVAGSRVSPARAARPAGTAATLAEQVGATVAGALATTGIALRTPWLFSALLALAAGVLLRRETRFKA